jgi:hypothetical protein
MFGCNEKIDLVVWKWIVELADSVGLPVTIHLAFINRTNVVFAAQGNIYFNMVFFA